MHITPRCFLVPPLILMALLPSCGEEEAPPGCSPGYSEARPCYDPCLEEVRVCGEDGTWADWQECSLTAACAAALECDPGEVEARGCDDPCQEEIRACDEDGAWGDWQGCVTIFPCPGTAEACTPGHREVRPCDDLCQEEPRFCEDSGAWGDWLGCLPSPSCGEGGECTPGHREVRPCEDPCQEQARACGEGGLWGVWEGCMTLPECRPVPECFPGALEIRPCDDPCQEQARVCGDEGLWDDWADCEPLPDCPPPPDCDPGHREVRPCEDPCQEEHRLCADDGAWGDWDGCVTKPECLISADCTPGHREVRPCEDPCQEEHRLCADDGAWDDWAGCVTKPECLISADCTPGHLEVRPCEDPCQEEARSCADDGAWGDWDGCVTKPECLISADCTPGHLEVRPCEDPCEEEARSCADDGAWDDWAGCMTKPECLFCQVDQWGWEACGDCSVRLRHCADDATWGDWEECLEAPFPEVCDGFDNDCDGLADEDDICSTCGFEVWGESDALSDRKLYDIVWAGEEMTVWGYRDNDTGHLELIRLTPSGMAAADPVLVALPGPYLTNVSWHSPGPLWDGEAFGLASAEVRGNPSDVIFRLWRISLAGEVVQTATALLPAQTNWQHTVYNTHLVWNERTERYLVTIKAMQYHNNLEDSRIFQGAYLMDRGGADLGEFLAFTGMEGVYWEVEGAIANGDGFLTLWRSWETGQLMMVRVGGDGLQDGPPREVNCEEGYNYYLLGSADEAVLVCTGMSDIRAGVMLVLDEAGQVVHQADIPNVHGVNAWKDDWLFKDGVLAYLMELRDQLFLARVNILGMMVDEPLVLQSWTNPVDWYLDDYYLAGDGKGYGVAWHDNRDVALRIRYTYTGPMPCDGLCASDPQCGPDETQSGACGIDEGICGKGHQERACSAMCVWSPWGACQDAIWPEAEDGELCMDGLDNDCDGLVDMDDPYSCNVCDSNPSHWICSECGWSYMMACGCLTNPDDPTLPCDCILSGSPQCDCTLHPGQWYCR